MATFVSTGFTLSLFAGLATGFIYLLIAGLRWAREIFMYERITNEESGSHWDQNKKTGIWLFKDLRNQFQSTVAAIHKSGRSEGDVREAIEKFIESLIGGSLDEVQVTKISSHPLYVDFFKKYEGVLSLTLSRLTASFQLLAEDITRGQPGTPDKILSQLKHLVKAIISEAQYLPLFQKVHFINTVDELASKSYEDILATAILNKIISSHQFSLSSANSSIELDNFSKKNSGDDSSDSHSIGSNSVDWEETWSESTDPLSVKGAYTGNDRRAFENNLEEDNSDEEDLLAFKVFFNPRTSFPEYGVDIVENSSSFTGFEKSLNVNTWEDNWLFKKKKLKQSINPTVSMLVPSPNEPVKAFIGDKDADETSDLSDCSDSELEHVVNSSDYELDGWLRNKTSQRSYKEKKLENKMSRRDSVEKESDSGIFEENVLRSSVSNLAFRSRETSHQFTVNPLFHDDSCYTPAPLTEQHFTSLQHPRKKTHTHTLVVPPRSELFSTKLTSLSDLRRT